MEFNKIVWTAVPKLKFRPPKKDVRNEIRQADSVSTSFSNYNFNV